MISIIIVDCILSYFLTNDLGLCPLFVYSRGHMPVLVLSCAASLHLIFSAGHPEDYPPHLAFPISHLLHLFN